MAKVNAVMNAGFLDTVFRLLKEDDSARRIARVFKMRGGVKSAGGNKWKFPYPQMGVLGAAEYAVKQLGGSIRPLGKEDGVNVAEITGPLHDALSTNAARSRNAVVQKALNARWRIIYKNLSGPLFPYGKETYSTREEAEKRAEELRKQSKEWGTNASYFVDVVGNSISANADTSVLRETAVNGPYEFGNSKLKQANVKDSLGETLKVGDRVTDWKGNHGVVVELGTWAGMEAVAYKTPNGVMMRAGPWVTKGDAFVKNSARTTNSVVAKALNARRVARNFTPQSEFQVGDVVRFRDSVRSVPHDETYTVVKVSGNNITIKGGRDNGTSVEFKNNLEIA